MTKQSSRFIIPFSIIVLITLIALLVFVFAAEDQGWFSETDELIESLEIDDDNPEEPVSFPEEEIPLISQSDFVTRNSIDNCYTAINDTVYEIPETFIVENENDIFDELVCGSDITEIFESQVDYTVNDLAEYSIGELTIVNQ